MNPTIKFCNDKTTDLFTYAVNLPTAQVHVFIRPAIQHSTATVTSTPAQSEYCDQRACMSVCSCICPLAYLKNHVRVYRSVAGCVPSGPRGQARLAGAPGDKLAIPVSCPPEAISGLFCPDRK